jgi:hypothetical protein
MSSRALRVGVPPTAADGCSARANSSADALSSATPDEYAVRSVAEALKPHTTSMNVPESPCEQRGYAAAAVLLVLVLLLQRVSRPSRVRNLAQIWQSAKSKRLLTRWIS